DARAPAACADLNAISVAAAAPHVAWVVIDDSTLPASPRAAGAARRWTGEAVGAAADAQLPKTAGLAHVDSSGIPLAAGLGAWGSPAGGCLLAGWSLPVA